MIIYLFIYLLKMDYSFRGILCKKEESELRCWGSEKDKGPLTRLYFKFPPLAKDEVRIKITHTGLCHSDCFKMDAAWGPNFCYPLVPGHEIVGIVEKVGAEATKYKIGDKVCFGVFRNCCGKCDYCMKGDDQLCENYPFKFTYDPYLGGYSDQIQVKESFTFPLPKKLDEKCIAPILCAGATCYCPLKRHCVPGGKCGVVGIGGLGHMALQYAHKMGMKVYCCSTSKDKEPLAKKLGADEFIITSDPEQVKRMSKEKFDVVINTAFLDDISPYVSSLRQGTGVLIQVSLPNVDAPVKFSNMGLVVGQQKIVGSMVGSRTEVQDCLNFSDQFNVQPITEHYTWANFPKAYEKLHNGKPIFRCVVDVSESFDEKY